ncbi:hypothetical protein J2X20_004359 [Pelomonas saccharophila]|uniref:YXWGXW repeat-containing protein n=1 Tax=Roseateles saccharophilus TaxID=304 RepID=A0ABU1YUQ2_ROSSA|nr:YXWGXW repeat-containing protein [Roseateles saccharophilus]MDR7271691.1 hypothetical protein [Roseateles saccharophilus]
MRKPTLLASCLAASFAFGAATLPSTTLAQTAVWIRTAPPPPRHEVVPAPRRGYVWVSGYWGWNGHRHVWHRGGWVKERHGYSYNQPTWVERDGRWEFRRGAWARGDADHDGVPNGADRRPNNPNRY